MIIIRLITESAGELTVIVDDSKMWEVYHILQKAHGMTLIEAFPVNSRFPIVRETAKDGMIFHNAWRMQEIDGVLCARRAGGGLTPEIVRGEVPTEYTVIDQWWGVFTGKLELEENPEVFVYNPTTKESTLKPV